MDKYIKFLTTIIVSIILCIYVVNPLVGATFSQNTSKATVKSTSEDNKPVNNVVSDELSSDFEVSKKENQVIQKPAVKSKSGCGGNWFKVSNFSSQITLDIAPVATWNAASNPTIVSETENSKNTVIIGHNRCKYGDCLRPFGQFAEIINSTTNDSGELCLNGEYYTGKVIFSSPVSQYDVHIMGDWMNKDIVTVFTCYGNCLDQYCNSTDQRYTIVFEKNKA